MAYVINKTDGTAFTTLQDATVNNDSSITLVGRNYIGYGEAQNENFLFLLENFAHNTAPSTPIAGQLWFDTNVNVIKVWDGDKWVEVGAAKLSGTPPVDPPTGAFWLKTPHNTLHTYNGSGWVFIGPETAEGFDTTRARSTTLVSDTAINHAAIELTVDGTVVGIVTGVPFRLGSTNTRAGFDQLDAGITLNSNTFIKGNLHGNADTASELQTTRKINGTGFDGTRDITITSSTTEPLRPGDYITGSSFNGSSDITWDVNATSANSIGTIVSRNAAGGFAAGLITANLSGELYGNVTATTGTSRFDVIQANSFVGPSLSGNAFSATKLRTARNINGVAFDGQDNITVPAAANTLTGISLATNVINSNLQQVGNLISLEVVGNILVNSNLTIASSGTNSSLTATRQLTITVDDGTDTSSIKIISPDVSVTAGTGANGALVPTTNGDVDLGKSNLEWDNVHANTFIGSLQGNADTATLATTAANIAGGAAGSFAYQTASGATALLPAGTAGEILHTGGTGGAPYWGSPAVADLIPGAYLNGTSYDGLASRQFDVDATSANTASKVVARDASGNFSAGTITANLTGNATTATTATNNVLKSGDTMTGFLTLHSNPTANLHAATKQYVDAATQGINPYWAGATTLANVQATYASFPTGTKVAFWNERVYNAPRNGNGGNATVYDRYKQTVQKQANGTWLTVG
jgi:hypothetical protein